MAAPKTLSVDEWRSMVPASHDGTTHLKTGLYVFQGAISFVEEASLPASDSIKLKLEVLPSGFSHPMYCGLILRKGSSVYPEKYLCEKSVATFFRQLKDQGLEGVVGVNFRYVGWVPNMNVNYLRIQDPNFLEAVISRSRVVFQNERGYVSKV